MSLRQAPRRTPAFTAAERQNSTHSTGPRSQAGKERTKMNALQHGAYTAPENQRAAMLALGEDPQAFEILKADLMSSYGLGDPLGEKQIDDLAMLYWRRGRLERLQNGLLRRARLEVEERQHERQRQMSNATFDPNYIDMVDVPIPESEDAGLLARRTLSYLQLARAIVRVPLDGVPDGEAQDKTKPFFESQLLTPLPVRLRKALHALYRNGIGWRMARIFELLSFLELYAGDKLAERCQQLVRLLDGEIADMRQELEHVEKLQAEKAAAERDACLAPVGETWATLLRQEAALDRAIDRKVRIILAMRREHARGEALVDNPPAEAREDSHPQEEEVAGGSGESDKMSEQPAPLPNSTEQSRNVYENKA